MSDKFECAERGECIVFKRPARAYLRPRIVTHGIQHGAKGRTRGEVHVEGNRVFVGSWREAEEMAWADAAAARLTINCD